MKTEIINAFHPLYARTYHPELFESLRTESRQTKAGQTLSTFVEKKRQTSPSHGTIQGISNKVIPPHMHRPKEMMKKSKLPILTKAQQRMTMAEVTNELIDILNKKGKK